MCQLLGVSSNKSVDIKFSIREFRHRGKFNKHGWGFAFRQNDGWETIKKPDSLANEDVHEKQFQFKSKIIIGHVRRESCGNKNYHNTHPFSINNWTFAHNGTVRDIMVMPEFKLSVFMPIGKTDSEYAFCYLMEKLQNKETGNIREVLEEEAANIRQYGNFNFLLSNGDTLFAHGDNSLYYVQRKAPFNSVTLRDDDYAVNLQEIKAIDEKAILIATDSLTMNENWRRIIGIKAFRDGEEI